VIVLDSNILIRLVVKSDASFPLVRATVSKLLQQGEELAYTTQTAAEAWVVLTRPASSRGGFGLSYDEARVCRNRLERGFVFLKDSNESYRYWKQFVDQYKIVGVNAHEARLVATMQVHGVSRILTFNASDFKRYQNLDVLTPHSVLASP
jgi:predicted nucleic acid-binding protein